MSRQIVQLHTLDQWLAADINLRRVLIQNIKLKDRLWRFLKWRRDLPSEPTARWVPCSRCDKKGWVLKAPRAAGIHPSQLAHSCLLKIYWEMEGKEGRERHDSRSLLIFDFGHALHHLFQGYGAMGAWGSRYWPESRLTGEKQRLAEELYIEGSADAENILEVDLDPSGPIYEVGVVHEYKTKKTEKFSKLTRPDPDHLVQATVYAKILNRPVVVFLYMNKNDSNLADYPVEFDGGTWAMVENKARTLLGHYDRAEPPAPSVGYHCQQCPYAYDCAAFRATQGRPSTPQNGQAERS